MNDKYLIVLAGPTASGKTATAIEIAKRLDTDIVSADSRQFYQEMTIGTAVPTKLEQAQAKHHLIHNKSIFDNYNVADYERDALSIIESLFETKKYAILTGGSGLYINAVCDGIDEMPDITAETREKVEEIYKQQGIKALQDILQRVDPEYYNTVDTNNPRRLQRAVEIYTQTGLPFSSFRKGNKVERNFKVLKIALLWDREALCQRIDTRVDNMMRDGLLDEATRLHTVQPRPNSLATVGYTELFEYLDGHCTIQQAIADIKTHTRQYAKRQMTWFRKNNDYQWFEHGHLNELFKYIDNKTS